MLRRIAEGTDERGASIRSPIACSVVRSGSGGGQASAGARLPVTAAAAVGEHLSERQRTAETVTRLRTVMRPRGPERYEPAVGATSR